MCATCRINAPGDASAPADMIFDGLESSAAVSVMRTLQRIASTGRTVICSIGTVPAQVLIFRTESSVANRQRVLHPPAARGKMQVGLPAYLSMRT